jgi:uncharacterized protein YdiU (UPF0061 family)
MKITDLILQNTFETLPAVFYTHVNPTPLPSPYLVHASPAAAQLLGLEVETCKEEAFVQILSGNRLLPSSDPLAAVYSGHQFGVWAGQLGDGRALLLGDAATPSGERLEVQLKGTGATPYSRMGDGRAVLRSSIREYLCSEAMAALKIPTSRALAIIGSDQYVMREAPETTAVVTRLAPSFLRFGSFEHWYYHQQHDALKTLADFVIRHYYPELDQADNPYVALLSEVTRRTAQLIAQWQAVGFMHGVMNTDNMSILGLTLDYGPFGFMEAYQPHHICNHTDQGGRYAYDMQPRIGQWNCFALAQALLPLIGSVEAAEAALEPYQAQYEAKFAALLHAKLGLQSQIPDDSLLIEEMFDIMQKNQVDFTLFFRRLGDLQVDNATADAPLRDLFIERADFDGWAVRYRARLKAENSHDLTRRLTMHATNPKYILRNYLAQIAIEKAQNKDFSEVDTLLHILEHPFDEQPQHEKYAALPPDWANDLAVSCSS